VYVAFGRCYTSITDRLPGDPDGLRTRTTARAGQCRACRLRGQPRRRGADKRIVNADRPVPHRALVLVAVR
jgi:hypothetical protein